ncbi:MAG: hypothetical protein ACKO3S_12250 [bacterium]
MIVVAPLARSPQFERLLAATGVPVHAARPAGLASGTPVTVVLGDAEPGPTPAALAHDAPGVRLLVLSRLGAHPDARATTLRRLWRLEEDARATGVPTLTLRLAPIVGCDAPLWARLATRPVLPGQGRRLVDPVHRDDVVATLVRAFGEPSWGTEWYEVAGAERFSWAELAEAAQHGPRATVAPAWEPSLDEIAEHRLAESEPWASRFGIAPTSVAAWARAGVA